MQARWGSPQVCRGDLVCVYLDARHTADGQCFICLFIQQMLAECLLDTRHCSGH